MGRVFSQASLQLKIIYFKDKVLLANGGYAWVSLQVNKEIVSGLKYIQETFRKGVKSKFLHFA